MGDFGDFSGRTSMLNSERAHHKAHIDLNEEQKLNLITACGFIMVLLTVELVKKASEQIVIPLQSLVQAISLNIDRIKNEDQNKDLLTKCAVNVISLMKVLK